MRTLKKQMQEQYPTEDEIMDIYNELEKDLKLKSPVILNYIKMWSE